MATLKTRRTLAKTGVLTGLIIGALFAGLPVLWMLSTSFKGNGEIFQSPPKLITKGFSFDAYTQILGNGAQLRFFLNSYIVALSVTALTLLVAILAAYAFSRFRFPFSKTINAVIVSVQAVPPITHAVWAARKAAWPSSAINTDVISRSLRKKVTSTRAAPASIELSIRSARAACSS